MKNKSVLLLGGSGSLGSSIIKKLNSSKNFTIHNPSSKILNFNNKKIEDKLFRVLKENNFDIIINCVGIFGFNDVNFNKIININTFSNWIILNYFILNKPSKKIKIIFIGSSAFNGARKDYILYTASKAALYSIYKSAKDYFLSNKKIEINIIHPKRFKSNMTKIFDEKTYKTTPSKIANQIYKLIIN